MRKLASVQKIENLTAIPNADKIELARILGWNVVVKKDEFKVGDLCVYFEIDSILPNKPWAEFLKDSNGKIHKLKTIKLRGQISQGLALPVDILFNNNPRELKELLIVGKDVTEYLGVTKWEPEEPACLHGKQQPAKRIIFPNWMPTFARKFIMQYIPNLARTLFTKDIGGNTFPPFLIKTDETRVQVLSELLNKYKGETCYMTEKLDGSSITVYLKDDYFGVCSRNIDLQPEDTNVFWKTVRQENIENKLRIISREYGIKNIAMQGELIGEGIQGNKYKVKGADIYWFNIFDINKQQYFDFFQLYCALKIMQLKMVPIINDNYILNNDIDELVKMSINTSKLNNIQREGVVIRPLKELKDYDFNNKLQANRVSFKVINPEFLIKFGE
jgi:RNA ligase (TIGR02306 family)